MSERPPVVNLELYLLPANIDLIRCVDERQAEDATNGVEIPGGIYGIIDAIKAIKGLTEEQAWQLAQESDIPIDAHVDDHHGASGCGYAKLVETDPSKVGAPEAILAKQRLERVRQAGGNILHYIGDHKPTHATINNRTGFSLDPDQAMIDGLGVFNYDAWAAREYANRLNINPEKFAKHIENVFKQTVTALTGMAIFTEFN